MWPLVIIAGVVLFGLGSRRPRTTRRATSSAETPPARYTTAGYAAGKVAMLRARLNDPRIRAAVTRWGARYLPGVPLEAVIALGASSTGADEQLNRAPGAWGLFGVEPSWIDAHGDDATTLDELGRAVTRASYRRDLEGQVYLGARRYAAALRAARDVGADVNVSAWGPFEYQCAVCAYSAGEGMLRDLLRRAPVAARHEPRGVRWTRIAEDTSRRILADRSQGLAWALIRPRERYAAALALTDETGAESTWYTDAETWDTSADVALSNLAHRRN